jgi:hypothetical protein
MVGAVAGSGNWLGMDDLFITRFENGLDSRRAGSVGEDV